MCLGAVRRCSNIGHRSALRTIDPAVSPNGQRGPLGHEPFPPSYCDWKGSIWYSMGSLVPTAAMRSRKAACGSARQRPEFGATPLELWPPWGAMPHLIATRSPYRQYTHPVFTERRTKAGRAQSSLRSALYRLRGLISGRCCVLAELWRFARLGDPPGRGVWWPSAPGGEDDPMFKARPPSPFWRVLPRRGVVRGAGRWFHTETTPLTQPSICSGPRARESAPG